MTATSDPERILHELQVHQIQLEMQNEELRDARCRLEELVEKYTDLYDFAPVGYFSIDESGRIQEVNLPGSAMLDVERSKLLHQRFSGFVTADYRVTLEDFLREVFLGSDKQVCELMIATESKQTMWVDLQATMTGSCEDGTSRCRLSLSDITAQKRAAEAQIRVETLEVMNAALVNEIARRKAVEKSLLDSRENQGLLLTRARQMQEELRMLSHQVLHTQEEERKRISHDLHDEVAQSLVAITIQLSQLAKTATSDPDDFPVLIAATQKLVERSLESVHSFALALRPTQLDDLGLLPALRGYVTDFSKQSGIVVLLVGANRLKPLGDAPAVALFRVAQAALNNVAQHAQAKKVQVDIRQTKRAVTMKISDDGISFDVKKALGGTKVQRLGLIGMRERVEMVGGKFTITSTQGKGTTISVSLPQSKLQPKPPASTPLSS